MIKEIWFKEYHNILDEIMAKHNLDEIQAYHYFETHREEEELLNDRVQQRIIEINDSSIG